MSDAIIKSAFFERAQLVFEGEGKLDSIPCIYNKNNKNLCVKASYYSCTENQFRIEYDVISGNCQYPLDTGEWCLNIKSDFGCADMDYSAHKVTYILHVTDGSTTNIESIYEPADIRGIRLVAIPFLKLVFFASKVVLRFVFNISRLFNSAGNIVLFTSESRDSIGGNMKYVLNKIIEAGIDKKYVFKYSFIDKNAHSKIRYAFFLIHAAFIAGRANIVIIDDYHPLIYQLNFKKGVKIVQLWHACGAFKAVGYARCGKQGAPTISNRSHRNYTHAIVSGEGVRRYYSEAFGIPIDRVYACGVPRTDELFSADYKKKSKEEVVSAYPQIGDKNIILFAPTFRGHGKKSANYPIDKIYFDKLEKYCRSHNSVVFFKLHPFVNMHVPISKSQSDVFIDAGKFGDINKLIACSEVLITDYSSSIYEAALLGTPIIFYVYDLDEYISERAFFKPFDQYLAGKVVHDFDSLITALENKDYNKDKLQTLIDSSVEKCDGNASQRVVDLIFNS